MKRILFVAITVAMLFASCANNDDLSQTTLVAPSEDFTASVDSEVRTSLDGTAVVWNDEDLLTIFTKTSHNRQYKVKNIADGGRTATFGYVSYTGSDNTAIAENYAVYPYDANATLVDGVVATSLSATQSYNATNGNISYALMAAKSANNSLAFENAGALMRFKVKSVIPDTFTLKAIKVASANNNIAGDVTIDLNGEECKAVAATTGVKEITLTDINTVVADEEKEFYVAMLATNFGENDLTVTFSFEEGDKVFTLPAFNLAQGKIKTVAYNIADTDDFTGTTPGVGDATDELETPADPANNEIWYTTTDSNVITFPYPYVFDANITSNVYKNGKGVITFDGDVTMLIECFEHFENLLTVSLPNSITTLNSCAFSYCSNLSKIVLGDNITTIANDAIVECPNISEIGGGGDINDGHCVICNGTLYYIFALEGVTSYSIPAGVNTISLNYRPESATLTELTIPNSVTSIETNFSGFSVLKTFAGKFASDDGTCLVIDGDLRYFAPVALEGLTSYNIPNNVKKISANFVSTTLTAVTIPEGAKEINANAFSQCPNIESVTGNLATDDGKCLVVDNKLIKLVDKKITSYNIPDGISAIGSEALSTANISTITVPASVATIDDCAFHSGSITEIYFKSTTPASISLLFNFFLVKNVKLFVPTEAVETYKSAAGWSDYADYIEGHDF